MYKLICLDIDGTLLDKNRDLSAETKSVFERLDKDIIVILASSRMPSAMTYLQDGLNIRHYPLICYNGGLIIDEHSQTLDDQPIPLECLSVLKPFYNRCNLSLYVKDSWYADQQDYWTQREINNTRVEPMIRAYPASVDDLRRSKESPQKIMCMGEKSVIDDIDHTLATAGLKVNRYRSKDTYLEITSKSTNKALALEQLIQLKYPKIKSSEIIAFGDNYNDIDLLTYAGCGVAMDNGRKELKSIADRITKSNINHGVASTLKEVYGL